jgi:hypothetical protein
MVLLTPRRVGRDRATMVMGYQFAAAAVGAAVLPAGIGVLVAEIGLEAVGPALVAAAAVMLAVSRVTEIASARAAG